MSEVERAAAGLLAAGVLGAGWMLVYLRACSWVDWEMLPPALQRRVAGWERRAPAMIVGSALVAGVGLLLGMVDAVGVLDPAGM